MTPQEQNFQDYKKAETKALELLAEMRPVAPRTVDIELALLVAIFELHRGTTPPATTARIIEGHLKTLVPHYDSPPSDGS